MFQARIPTALLLLTIALLGPAAVEVRGEDAPGAAAAAIPAGQDFGAGLTLTELSPLRDVITHPEKYEDKAVLVRGEISDVCQRKGCWMVLREGESHVRIRFQDYGFFVPSDSCGKQAYVEGRVARKTISEKAARHYAEESKDGDPSQIQGDQQVVSFTATGVRLVSR